METSARRGEVQEGARAAGRTFFFDMYDAFDAFQVSSIIDGGASVESNRLRLPAWPMERSWYERPHVWAAELHGEPGVLTRLGWAGTMEFHGWNGAHRRWDESPEVEGFCAADTSGEDVVVVRGRSSLLGPIADVESETITRPGRQVWEIGLESACIRQIDWELFSGDEHRFGAVRLERVRSGRGERLEARYVMRDTVLPLEVSPADGPAPNDIARRIRETGCDVSAEAIGPCASQDTAPVPARLTLDGATIVLLPPAPGASEDSFPSREEEDAELRASLPPWVESLGMTCVCGTCFYTFAIGSEPSAAARMKLNALIGDASRAWDGDASDGLFAAVYRAGIDFARIRGGRTARLPSLSTTACLPNILAIDARATSVLLTDCPLDESSIFVRWMELHGRTWVDRVEPLDAHVRSPSRIRGILVNGVPAVFSASGATGAAHRVEGGAWHAVEHRWATRP